MFFFPQKKHFPIAAKVTLNGFIVVFSFSIDEWGEGESLKSGGLGWKRTGGENRSGRRATEGGKQYQQVSKALSTKLQQVSTLESLILVIGTANYGKC